MNPPPDASPDPAAPLPAGPLASSVPTPAQGATAHAPARLASSSAPVLAATGLSKLLAGRAAIDGLNLSLRAGEILCVAGPNGAGKTTLLSLLAGASYPSSGHVTVFGLHRWKRNFQIRRRSSFVPSETAYGACPTPAELCRLVARVYGLSLETFRERLARLAGRMSMTEHMKKPWDRLSWGMRRKAGLVAGFLPDAELRILDEPFGGGIDSLASEALREWMREARARGEALIFSTPEPDRAEGIADRIVVLDDGREVAEGTPEELVRASGIDPAPPEALGRAFRALLRRGERGAVPDPDSTRPDDPTRPERPDGATTAGVNVNAAPANPDEPA